jgi:hypothetical protein
MFVMRIFNWFLLLSDFKNTVKKGLAKEVSGLEFEKCFWYATARTWGILLEKR